MANFRQVHTKIWKDGWFLDLEPRFKLFFIYLFTNECASICGLYELPKRVMSFESGLSYSEINQAFEIFQDAGKAHYDDGVVFVENLRKYHETKSPKVQSRIIKDLDAVKDCQLKGIYCEKYGIDRVSKGYRKGIDGVSIPPSTSTSTYKSSNKKGARVSAPDNLNTPEFDVWWNKWCDHLEERGKKLTKAQLELLLKDLSEWGHDRVIAAIKHSIKGGWLSIHEPDERGGFNDSLSSANGAWSEVWATIDGYGSRAAPKFDEKTSKAVQLAGGYKSLCKMDPKEAKKRFQMAYNEAVSV